MKKNIIIIFTLLVLFIAINIWLLPNIDYTKNNDDFERLKEQSISYLENNLKD